MTDQKPARLLKKQVQVARYYGKSPRTIRNWLRAGMPRRDDGWFDLNAIDKWLQMRDGIMPLKRNDPGIERPATNGEDPETKVKSYWESENKRLQAEERSLKLRIRRGELIERHQVEKEFVSRVLAFRSGLLGLERSLPPDLARCQGEREMAAVLRRAFRGLLDSYSRPLPAHLRPLAEAQKIA